MFDTLAGETIKAFDRIIGLELGDVAVDGSLHKAPGGGEGTGPNPTDRAKLGWKWSICTDRARIPSAGLQTAQIATTRSCWNRPLTTPLSAVLLADIGTLWLDRGYDSNVTRERLADRDNDDAVIAKKRKTRLGSRAGEEPVDWTAPAVERTNSWLSNFGGLRPNNDRKTMHRLAQLAFAVTILLTAKPIDWRNRWSPAPAPHPLCLLDPFVGAHAQLFRRRRSGRRGGDLEVTGAEFDPSAVRR